MTLVVSLRVPDGVILAADSLQTSQVNVNIVVTDPQTKRQIPAPPLLMPTSTSSYAQKLFSFKEKFGVAIFGTAVINNRTIYNHIKKLESTITDKIESVSKAGEILMEYFDKQLDEQLKIQNVKRENLNDNQMILGLQVVGFENNEDVFGHTMEVLIKKKSEKKIIDGIGCTVSGDSEVVRKLWEISQQNPSRQTNYASFSLKDAVDYVEFLINTTAYFQRFANMIPTVGGAVDIALVTNYSDFKWIKYKDLTKILEDIKT